MISCLKLQPIYKKILIMISIALCLIYMSVFAFGYMQFDDIHQKQVETMQELVGILVTEYPDKENEIVSSVLNTNDKDAAKVGEEVLKKYGYDLEFGMYKDVTFKAYRKDYIEKNIMFFSISILGSLLVIVFMGSYTYKYLEKISNVLNEFIKGNYSFRGKFNDEGIVNIISTQLDQLGRLIIQNNNAIEREKEQSKELVTDISHQLKTPLASLSLCNSLLQEEYLSDDERKEFIQTSEYNISKLDNLIDSLVNISRLEAAMIKINLEQEDIKNTIIRAVNSVYMKAEAKNTCVDLKDIYSINILHDTKWTEEAIFNVLENAVKYTDKGGAIEVSMSQTINYVRIDIKDTGIGIKKEEYNSIFKRFYRGKNINILEIEGSGVGLYLTRKILEDQGGNVIVKSKQGEGSIFSLFLQKCK